MFILLSIVFFSLVKQRQFWFPRFSVQKRDGGIETAVLLIYTLAIALVCDLRGRGVSDLFTGRNHTTRVLSGPFFYTFSKMRDVLVYCTFGGETTIEEFSSLMYVHKTKTKFIDFIGDYRGL